MAMRTSVHLGNWATSWFRSRSVASKATLPRNNVRLGGFRCGVQGLLSERGRDVYATFIRRPSKSWRWNISRARSAVAWSLNST